MRITDQDLWLFNEGRHADLARFMGAHPSPDGGYEFAVWAPDAEYVEVVGDFNGWESGRNPLTPLRSSGIWTGHVPNAHEGNTYKFGVSPRQSGYTLAKADPYAHAAELPPKTASVLTVPRHQWGDAEYMEKRAVTSPWRSPVSIYEVHLGSWRHGLGEGSVYRLAAQPLAEYVSSMGYTHIELLPVMEHPFFGSWGYQVTGFFAPTARYGTPDDFRYFVDVLHQHGVGVILDWVPAHFPTDEHGLARFDGTCLYEHADPRQGWHPDWQTLVFNYDRNEVRSFLISSAMYWLDSFHVDGLRVDAVASMLYLDYSREDGQWIPNRHGGNENLGAIEFMQQMNTLLHARHPNILMIAEESTAWGGVSRPIDHGGLGFGFKWDMGWMHDTLHYMARDPIHRRYHHDEITFRALYAFTENYVLALSHDEVVHGKGSLPARMPGDKWQRYANVRLLFGYQMAQPGKKLMFMGMEFAQWEEWNHDHQIHWHLLDDPVHEGVRRWVSDLNALYGSRPSLYRKDLDPSGVDWSGMGDRDNSVLVIYRFGDEGDEPIVAVCNFTPVVREHYDVGVPVGGEWRVVLNSDDPAYGGSGVSDQGTVQANDHWAHGKPASLTLTLPPLATLFLEPVRASPDAVR